MNKKFDIGALSEELQKALDALGYIELTDVQKAVMPLVFTDKDVIVRAQTGSGKTAAFAIPICEKVDLDERYPQALVLTPTRELAVQVRQDIFNIGRFKKIRCAAIYGGQPMEIQKRELRQRVHVIVGTPGRTLDHIERENINLAEIKFLILDEADKMLDLGFIDEVESIIKKLPDDRMTMVLSATMPERVHEICVQYMNQPILIEIESEKPAENIIHQQYFVVAEADKFNLVTKIIYTRRPESCILFCNTRERVDTLFEKMKSEGYLCGGLHGGMEQKQRLEIIKKFKCGEFQFLIATDVAARGIHVDNVSLVINYDIPQDNESYVHRIGRTGRAGNEGDAITLLTKDELEFFADIEAYIGYKIGKEEAPAEDAVEKGKKLFKIAKRGNIKNVTNDKLNSEITRIRINAGKKSKMRPGDILGALTSISGIAKEQIGIIDVQDTCSYVEILAGKGEMVIDELCNTKIKGKKHTIKKVAVISH